MATIRLQFSTREETIDALLREIVASYENTFCGRISGYYLFGSYADGSAVPASDLDLMLVFRDEKVEPREAQRVHNLAADWSRRCGVHLDALPLCEGSLRREGHFRLKDGSVLLYGDDIRASLPDIPLTTYLRDYTNAPFGYAAEGFRHTRHLTYPLTYPDPDDRFCGYVLDNPEPLKALVSAACWDASLLVTLATGRTVASKRESVRLYRESIGGHWADYLEMIYTYGKQRWNYAVPTTDDERQLLQQTCQDYLALENHYFAQYRLYLLAELASNEPARSHVAATRLTMMTYPDQEIAAALEAVANRR